MQKSTEYMLVNASEDCLANLPEVEPGTVYIAAQRRLTHVRPYHFRAAVRCISEELTGILWLCSSMQLQQVPESERLLARWVQVRCSGAKVVLLRVRPCGCRSRAAWPANLCDTSTLRSRLIPAFYDAHFLMFKIIFLHLKGVKFSRAPYQTRFCDALASLQPLPNR